MNQIKFFFFVCAFCFFGLSPVFCGAATLTGADTGKAGELLTVTSDEEGDWIVTPIKGVTLAKDTNGKIVHLVASVEGEFTIIFIGVKEGKAVITQKLIEISGSDIKPAPTPEPEPKPSPSPTVKLTEKEKKAASEAVQVVLDGIEDGTIQTTNGARSAFKQAISARGTVCNGYTCSLPESLKKLSEDWTDRCDFTSLKTVKTSFENFLKEVK